jgi:hypothetical protein
LFRGRKSYIATSSYLHETRLLTPASVHLSAKFLAVPVPCPLRSIRASLGTSTSYLHGRTPLANTLRKNPQLARADSENTCRNAKPLLARAAASPPFQSASGVNVCAPAAAGVQTSQYSKRTQFNFLLLSGTIFPCARTRSRCNICTFPPTGEHYRRLGNRPGRFLQRGIFASTKNTKEGRPERTLSREALSRAISLGNFP